MYIVWVEEIGIHLPGNLMGYSVDKAGLSKNISAVLGVKLHKTGCPHKNAQECLCIQTHGSHWPNQINVQQLREWRHLGLAKTDAES